MGDHLTSMDFSKLNREEAWKYLTGKLQDYYANTQEWEVTPTLDKGLKDSGWTVYNKIKLPIICFNKIDKIDDPNWIKSLVDRLVKKGQMWLSVNPVNKRLCARICVTNYKTRKDEVDMIVNFINDETSNL